jgi:hypothetical protein
LSSPEYNYSIEQCDVPAARRAALEKYRAFRRCCLERLTGDSETSVRIQINDLAWQTAVFRTLNEARRLEPDRKVNGALWELVTEGYATMMALGIRKLVDKNSRTDSILSIMAMLEQHSELLTRENFVCHDGLPYDYESIRDNKYKESWPVGTTRLSAIKGPEAWSKLLSATPTVDELNINSPPSISPPTRPATSPHASES